MSLSQAGSTRFILISVLIILIALVGAGAWLSYSTFKIPSPEPAAPAVAVRSKIPAPPTPMQVPQPQKIEAPNSEAQPAAQETGADSPGLPVVAGVAPAATVPASHPESKQDAPPALQTTPSPAETPKPSAAEATKEPDKGPGSELEISKARNDRDQEAQSMQPAFPHTAPGPVITEEKTSQAPSAPASPESESEALEPAESAPEEVVALPAEQERSTPEPAPAAAKPGPAQKSVTAKAETQKQAPYTIQVGAYLTKAYAELKQTDLEQRGYEPFIYQTTDKKQRTWYLVRVGHFEDRPAAERFLSDFTAKENMPAVIALSKRR